MWPRQSKLCVLFLTPDPNRISTDAYRNNGYINGHHCSCGYVLQTLIFTAEASHNNFGSHCHLIESSEAAIQGFVTELCVVYGDQKQF